MLRVDFFRQVISLKLKISHLKMDGWNISFLWGPGLFSVAFAVSFRELISPGQLGDWHQLLPQLECDAAAHSGDTVSTVMTKSVVEETTKGEEGVGRQPCLVKCKEIHYTFHSLIYIDMSWTI